jgi:hypothetical protein
MDKLPDDLDRHCASREGRQSSSERGPGLDILTSARAPVGRRKLLACRALSIYWQASPRDNSALAGEQ